MPTFANPPDGWAVWDDTVWGTDADGITPGNRGTGSYALRILATANDGAGMVQDMIVPQAPGLYRLRARVRASSITAGNKVVLELIWDNDAGFPSGTIGAYASFVGELPSANVWHEKSIYLYVPATAYGIYVLVGRAVGQASQFSADFDSVIVEKVPLWFDVSRATTQSVNSGSWTKVQFATEADDPAACFDASTNHRFDVPFTGVYSLHASVEFESLTSGKQASLRIRKNAATIMSEQDSLLGATHGPVIQATTGPIKLAAGDYIEVDAYHDYGSARNVGVSGSSYTWLRGCEVA